MRSIASGRDVTVWLFADRVYIHTQLFHREWDKHYERTVLKIIAVEALEVLIAPAIDGIDTAGIDSDGSAKIETTAVAKFQ